MFVDWCNLSKVVIEVIKLTTTLKGILESRLVELAIDNLNKSGISKISCLE